MHLPNAFLLTFTTYGSHLPGDPRGWCHHARGVHPPDEGLFEHSQRIQRAKAVHLEHDARIVVLGAIVEVCAFRGWLLRAAHVRTEHVHLVAGGDDPDRIIRDCKAYSTRALRMRGLCGVDARVWARGGSTVPLRDERAVEDAARYTYERQGEPMARWP